MDHSLPIALTLIFILTFVYSAVGALISGASHKGIQNVCISCLFSLVIIASVLGVGFCWNFRDSDISKWWMVGTVLLLVSISEYAQRMNTWQKNSLTEPQKTGNES